MATVLCDAENTTGAFTSTLWPALRVDYEDTASALLSDTAGGLVVTLAGTSALVSTVTFDQGPVVTEVGTFGNVLSSVATLAVLVTEAPRLLSTVDVAASGDLASTGVMVSTLFDSRYTVITETPALVSTVTTSTTSSTTTIDERGALTSDVTNASVGDLTGTSALASTVTPVNYPVGTVNETPAGASTVFLAVVAAPALLASVSQIVSSVPSYSVASSALALDEADLESFTLLGGDYAAGAWTCSTDSWAASRYAPFAFDSIVSLAGYLFAAGEGGLVRFDADTDAGDPIDASLDTGLGQFGQRQLKLTQAMYLGYSSDTPMTVRMGVTDSGSESQYDYLMPERAATDLVSGRVPLGRGLRSRYMRVVLSNTSGGDFRIAEAMLEVDVSTRRV